MSGILANLFRPLRAAALNVQSITSTLPLVTPETFSLTSIRTKVRCYFPRPNEVKRVRTQGWQARISTPNGRRVIMRRMLKGRLVLTH